MNEMERYYCSSCKEKVTPIIESRKVLFLKMTQLICPLCGNSDLKPLDFDDIQNATDDSGSVPSLDHFLDCYNRGDNYRALGIPQNSSKDTIRAAMDDFQMAHISSAPEWSIPLANIREHMLNKTTPIEGTFPKKLREIDRNSWVKALPYLEKAEKMESRARYIEAMEQCSKAIEVAPSCFFAYQKRAWIGLLTPDFKQHLDQIIDDCTITIRYDPHNAQAYNDRGRAYARKGDLELASRDYHQSLMYNPGYVIAALNAMEADICLGKYRLAVGTFGAFKRDVATPTYMVIAHSLVCLALSLDGKEYADKLKILQDKTIRVRNFVDWCTVEIDHNLQDLEQRGYDSNRLKKAKEIQSLFKEHFD